MPPTPPAICDTLLFLSRAAIPPQDADRSRALCARVKDWPLLTDIARRKFSLPFVYRNLQRLNLDETYAPALNAMRAQVMPTTFGALRVLAAQRKFHRDCVAPLGLAHVYLKGPSLAARYYDDPGLRFARDIDVLVSREDQKKLVHQALSQGYQIVDRNELKSYQVSHRDLDAILTYKTVATLVTPDNIAIEVHWNIDKKLGLFAVHETLQRRETIPDDTLHYGVMPTADFFCYVCYHNTRHIWSRLHWIADLDAIITHSSFERNAVLARAAKLGLRSNVEACLELHEIAVSGEASTLAKGENRGAELAAICLKNLPGDLKLEYDLREGEELLGLPFKWMVSPDVRKRARTQTRLSRVLPGYEEYEAWPLPRGLQWVYYVSKPLGILKRHLFVSHKQDAGL
ncbi:nucleotidyltransferase family protein [Ruegeria atlantica]|uniref:nucleotidyltransferase family protein n=1 Tax=Ruegeria atlantica TaxID=81569 RepID=UPI0024952183|nr:nucleotidyltransferase family protein [Ruegeria atlantica]